MTSTSSMSASMTSWIRRRFDSAESDDIPESPEPQIVEENSTISGEIVTKTASLCIESETDVKNNGTNGGNGGQSYSRGVTKVKTQWHFLAQSNF